MPAMPSRGMIRLAFIAAVIATVCVILVIIAFSFFPQIETMLSTKSSDGADVVVVGGGLAGLSATVEAVRHGARVTIIEKEASVGGNSAKATSGMNGAGTAAQRNLDIEDSPEFLVSDTVKSGSGRSKEELVSILATNSASAVEFITAFEVGLTNVVQLGGHSIPRTHRIPPTKEGKPVPVGFTIISTLKKYVENEISASVHILTNSVFHSLLWDGDRVVGVAYKAKDGSEHQLYGNVILTAGGFANDRKTSDSLLAKYVPHLSKLPTTNGVWATGDIIKATAADGLSLVDMDQVQVHPTGFIEPSRPDAETKFLAPEALRGCGAILLDASGRRFVNELGRRDHVTQAIFDHCAHYQNNKDMPVTAVMLMNEEVIQRFGAGAVGFYKFKGLIEDVGSVDQVAVKLGVDAGILRETIESYQTAAAAGEDQLGKVSFPTAFSENDHFYVAYITPSLHYCMGGLEINEAAQVLKAGAEKRPVPGLFAAGEVTGGVHGANRLGGNSLLECVVYGRISGQHAAHSSSKL